MAGIQRGYKFQLAPTATYKSRSCTWLATPGHDCDGILMIVTSHAKYYKVEEHVYGIEEIAAHRPDTRKFMVLSLSDDDQEQPYEVTVGAANFRRCTCDAGTKAFRKVTCKHMDAIRQLIEAGKLPARHTQGA